MRVRRTIGGGRDVTIVGGRPPGARDIYHALLRLPPWILFVALAGVYLGLNGLFAGLYLMDPAGVSGLRPGHFEDAFFFSVQTVSTVGYGALAPRDLYANLVVTAECFTGLVLVAVTTGVIFARVSRPNASVVFSEVATVANFDGAPHLMFRAVNERSNQILEAEVMVSLVRMVRTAEGALWRRFQDLEVTRRRTPLFALSWTIMHRLDDSSPLAGATAESLADEDARIIVVLSGVDDAFTQRVHARHTYAAADIAFDHEFEALLLPRDDGRVILDFRKFHSVKPVRPKGPD